MINDKVRMYLLPPLFNAAVRAGASIMHVYKNLDDYDISLKDDKTPITLATTNAATGSCTGWSIRWTARSNLSKATTNLRSTSP